MLRDHTGVQHLTDAVFDLRYELRIEMGCPQLPFKIVIFMDQFCTLRGEPISVGYVQGVCFQIPDGLLKLFQFLYDQQEEVSC